MACFDTAFHRTNPDVAQRFALPAELHDAGVRRYGFHGLSYEYIASVLPAFDRKAAAGKTVVLHLGNGSSMCAMEAGRSVASTMGFTAVDGLPMGTRCGALDPGRDPVSDGRAEAGRRAPSSGSSTTSRGSSGCPASRATCGRCWRAPIPRAKLAIDVYVYRIRRELGSLAGALGGLDAVVFTAGIGENAPAIRERVCRDSAWLGIDLDAAANRAGGPADQHGG